MMSREFKERRSGRDRRASAQRRHSDSSQKAFQVKFALVAIALLAVNLGVGFFSWTEQRQLIARAVGVYDTAFVSANVIHLSELTFAEYAAAHAYSAAGADEAAQSALLRKAMDEFDTAVNLSPNAATRAERESVRRVLAALAAADVADPGFASKIEAAKAALARAGLQASAGGLKARDEIQGFTSQSDLYLLAMVGSSVALAATSLMILRGMISRMTYLANYDSLTGLPKRPPLQSRLADGLQKVRAGNGKIALLSLDLDRFKQVNDTLGHQMGDYLLIEVAQRIGALLGPDDIGARFGGDEFVILMGKLNDPLDAGALAQRLVDAIAAPYEIRGQRILIGASVGIAIAPDNSDYADDLLRNSDLALYRAKAEGKGRCLYFANEMNAVSQARRVMEIELREALEQRQLAVHFQPLIDIASGRIVSCEALVRWNHPTHGYIAPSDFLPMAEETGLIMPLGLFVLREACIEAAHWAREISVAVNLSAVQFRTEGLVAHVKTALADSGLRPERLELEITESLLMARKEEVLAALTELRAMGVRISLDDFGTGYSSLAYLSSFPFDKIKIDKSFVRDVGSREDSAAIIRAITSLAGTLGMCTTAEGVETVDELDWLRAQGCHEGQGFLFSRPVPASEVRLLLGMPRPAPLDEASAHRAA